MLATAFALPANPQCVCRTRQRRLRPGILQVAFAPLAHIRRFSSDSVSDATATRDSADASERRPYQRRGARRQSGVATRTRHGPRTAPGPGALPTATTASRNGEIPRPFGFAQDRLSASRPTNRMDPGITSRRRRRQAGKRQRPLPSASLRTGWLGVTAPGSESDRPAGASAAQTRRVSRTRLGPGWASLATLSR